MSVNTEKGCVFQVGCKFVLVLRILASTEKKNLVIRLYTHSPQCNSDRDILVEGVVLQHEQIDFLWVLFAADDVRLRLNVRCVTGY